MDSDELRYATVHFSVRRKLKISFADYIFLDMVHVLSGKYGKCFKSTSSLAHDMGLSFNGVKKMIDRLLERELLARDGDSLVVSQAFIDIAYFNKTGRVSKIAQSVGRKAPKKDVGVSKIAQSAITKDVITSESAQSAIGLHKVQRIAQSSDKNKSLEEMLEVSTNVETGEAQPTKTQLAIADTILAVVLPKDENKSSQAINEMFLYWLENVGYPIEGQVKKNRFACSNLLKKHGKEGLKKLINGVVMAKEEQYAPDISDFCELQSKANKLMSWGHRRKKANTGGVVAL